MNKIFNANFALKSFAHTLICQYQEYTGVVTT